MEEENLTSPVYTSDMPKVPASAVCDPPAENYSETDLMALFPKGVASDLLVPDATTGRIPVGQLQSHVNELQQRGILKSRPTGGVASNIQTDMNALVQQDAALYSSLQEEYCYYEQRYRYGLKQFLKNATSRNTADNVKAQDMLGNTKQLNIRVNSVLEIMNYLAQARVDIVNQNKDATNYANKSINDKMSKLKATYEMLNRTDAVVTTQREMVRYTEEKNNYTTNQVTVWAALNILALGTIFYVYRN
jgi:cellobiose phosphorylase